MPAGRFLPAALDLAGQQVGQALIAQFVAQFSAALDGVGVGHGI